jgi:integrase
LDYPFVGRTMPTLIHKPPKYSLHKPSGQAKVRYNGQTVYLGKYGSKESHDRYAAFIQQIPKRKEGVIYAAPTKPETGDQEASAPLLVGELVLQFFEHAKVYYRCNGVPTGEHITIRACLRPLVKRFGQFPAKDFGPLKLETVRDDMIKLGWCRNYINKAVSIAKRCFKWGASKELVPGDVVGRIWTVQGLEKHRSAAREKPDVGPVSDDDLNATLPHLPDLDADVIRVMRLTGARPGEVLAMTAKEIDRTDSACWVFRPSHHKTSHKSKSRAIFIGIRAQEIILPRILKTEPGARLFPTTRGALCHAVHLGCEKAGVPRWSPNMVRHTVATEIRAKFGLEAAQVLLGHTKANVTEVYAERDERRAADIARKIG